MYDTMSEEAEEDDGGNDWDDGPEGEEEEEDGPEEDEEEEDGLQGDEEEEDGDEPDKDSIRPLPFEDLPSLSSDTWSCLWDDDSDEDPSPSGFILSRKRNREECEEERDPGKRLRRSCEGGPTEEEDSEEPTPSMSGLRTSTKRSWEGCWGVSAKMPRVAEVCAEGAEEDDQERERTATGGRWSTSCSRTTSVVSGRDLNPFWASMSLWGGEVSACANRPAVWDSCVHIQPEPEAGESATALEDILHHPSAKDTAPQGAQQLQAGSSDISSDEDPGETGPGPSVPAGELFHGNAAVQPGIGVDDAVIYLLHTSLTHLEKAGSTVRIMFFDFSSAFNTIQWVLGPSWGTSCS
ncbi:hypothetical protein L3Q82_003013 [Scortum barcoo]|uniref:Uncharacterized protein n=1 Tax=Scortum barcoo TaxID=214431 RepID=A0ACB8VQN2_9TELE|nr:hypothetical protein L3Q82_003013 [Scortum barcoo]